jgi:5,10-methylene-tetrahydrofolate dehydrogenase/methenyl tetrahydrofolate cyclohydrolase
MSAQLIDGHRLRMEILRQIEEDLIRLKRRTSGVPGLAVIRRGR